MLVQPSLAVRGCQRVRPSLLWGCAGLCPGAAPTGCWGPPWGALYKPVNCFDFLDPPRHVDQTFLNIVKLIRVVAGIWCPAGLRCSELSQERTRGQGRR